MTLLEHSPELSPTVSEGATASRTYTCGGDSQAEVVGNANDTKLDGKALDGLASLLEEHRLQLRRFCAEWSLQQDALLNTAMERCGALDSNSQGAVTRAITPVSPIVRGPASGVRRPSDAGLAPLFVTWAPSPTTGSSPYMGGARGDSCLSFAPKPSQGGNTNRSASQLPTQDFCEPIMDCSVSTDKVVELMMCRRRSTLDDAQDQSLSCSDRLGQKLRALNRALQRKAEVTSPFFGSLVTNQYFQWLCALAILLNTGVFAYTADRAMQRLEEDDPPGQNAIEICFTVIYTIELILRLLAYRYYFFFSLDWCWNIFDMLLVCSAIYDHIRDRVSPTSNNANLTSIRVLRLLKMIKLLRVVRIMRAFRELRLLMSSIMDAMRPMFWSLFLLVIITYIFGLCFLQAETAFLKDNRDNIEANFRADIDTYWGTILRSMLTLYMASTNGVNWSDVAYPLLSAGWFYYLLFLIYISFFMFVVANAFTSLFVEATVQRAERDTQMTIQSELSRKQQYLSRAKQVFCDIDGDSSGIISLEEFCDHLEKPEMYALASMLEIDVVDFDLFFRMLSNDGQCKVDLETFLLGCMKLKGGAKSIDLLALAHAQRKMSEEMREQILECQNQVQQLVDVLLSPNRSAAGLVTAQL